MSGSIGTHFLQTTIADFRRLKWLAEAAMEQVDDADLHRRADDEANSIYIVAKHMAGNMLSRWTDFLTSDGEKPWRERDNEFEPDDASCEALLAMWEKGWACCMAALEALGEDDLMRTVTIRQEPHTVIQALQRQLSHYAYHVGQIVEMAREVVGPQWTSLSVPRGESARFAAAPPKRNEASTQEDNE